MEAGAGTNPFLCLDLTYISVLLQELGFPPDKELKVHAHTQMEREFERNTSHTHMARGGGGGVCMVSLHYNDFYMIVPILALCQSSTH